MSSRIEVYTDGSCHPNPNGPGGWAAIIEFPDEKKDRVVLTGGGRRTTNNRMELIGPIKALQHLKDRGVDKSAGITIYSDSQYFVRGFRDWVPNWVRRGWKTADDKPVENQDLWKILLELKNELDITVRHVRGHDGHPQNEECDVLASEMRLTFAEPDRLQGQPDGQKGGA